MDCQCGMEVKAGDVSCIRCGKLLNGDDSFLLGGYTKDQHEGAAGMSLDDRFMLQHEQPCDCAVCDDIRFRRSIRERAMPKPAQTSGWLVEQTGANSGTWLAEDAPMGTFTADPNNVIRFARKQDAEAVIKILGLQATATEHIWYGDAE